MSFNKQSPRVFIPMLFMAGGASGDLAGAPPPLCHGKLLIAVDYVLGSAVTAKEEV